MRLPEARRPSCISSRRAAAFACALFRVALAAAAMAAALVGSDPAIVAVLPIGPDGGSLLCSGRSGRRTPRVALGDGAGGFFLGWQEHAPNSTIVGRVLVARFDGTGQPLWPAPAVLSTTLLAQSPFSRAVADGSGGLFASWLEPFPGNPDGYQPRMQHLDAAGTATMPAGGVRIDPARRIFDPVVLAPWRPTATAGAGGIGGGGIAEVTRAHLILADGPRPWGATGRLVMPGQTGLQPNDVAFALAPDGSLRVTWIETDGFMLDRLMARRLDPDGRMPWPEPVAMLEAIGMLERSEVVMPDGALLVAAAVTTLDMRAAPGDIIAQAIDARGRTKTAVAGFDVCRADRLQSNPIFMPASGAPASLLWVDKRAGVGVDGADNYFTQSLAYTSAPRLAPPSFTALLRQGRPIVVTIEGDDLAADLTATMGAGIEVLSAAVDPIQVDGPGDRLLITLCAAANAPFGPRALRIINPDGSAAEAPAVVNVTLDSARIDIDGSRLVDGLDLALLAGRFGGRVEQ